MGLFKRKKKNIEATPQGKASIAESTNASTAKVHTPDASTNGAPTPDASLRARPAISPVDESPIALEEQIAALAAAAAIQADDITAVISAAVAAYEADTYGGTINGIPAAHVAAITAAIAEIDSGDTTGDRYEKYDHAVPRRPEGWQGLYVQRIRRVSKSLPAWGVAGNREVIDSRRM
jgi:hypothetical protein